MKKTLTALAAALVLAFTLSMTPTDASARGGRAVAAGVIGLAAGAIIGGAIANSSPAYAYPQTYYPAPGYVAYPGYAAAGPMACPGGYWARRPIHDRWGNFLGWSRPRFFCP